MTPATYIEAPALRVFGIIDAALVRAGLAPSPVDPSNEVTVGWAAVGKDLQGEPLAPGTPVRVVGRAVDFFRGKVGSVVRYTPGGYTVTFGDKDFSFWPGELEAVAKEGAGDA